MFKTSGRRRQRNPSQTVSREGERMFEGDQRQRNPSKKVWREGETIFEGDRGPESTT